MKRDFSRSFAAIAFALMAILPVNADAQETLRHSIAAPPVGTQSNANLASAVAVEGEFVVLGAPSDGLFGADAGVLKVFNASTGELLYVLPNPEPAVADEFGASVAISVRSLAHPAWRGDPPR